MKEEKIVPGRPSLIERAAELYDFQAGLHGPLALETAPTPSEDPAPPVADKPAEAIAAQPAKKAKSAAPRAAAKPKAGKAQGGPVLMANDGVLAVDRALLERAGFILPEVQAGVLAEEFRLVKRPLLANIAAADPDDIQSRVMLVASASANEGKTFCATNLALSLASERDVDVLLVDADVLNPTLFSGLGLAEEGGLLDALADHGIDPNTLVKQTDIDGLSLLASGSRANNATELLASARARDVIAALAADPRRILIIDSPPVLLASPASALAGLAGQAIIVVRADETAEADLRETVELLSACPNLSLLLNGVDSGTGSRRLGTYYDPGESV